MHFLCANSRRRLLTSTDYPDRGMLVDLCQHVEEANFYNARCYPARDDDLFFVGETEVSASVLTHSTQE